ncbi:MAG TPA: phosphopantothenoylcysteine decarboxylase, partial [Bdellovibrionota bacterium]|nr:phosphopantothenoylcysteine decarboxylase [Bdellovibrionota bacterium]
MAEQISNADAFLVAPATLNTLQKFIHGMADSPHLTLLASAWGTGKPIIWAPAMHESLWMNPAFQQTLEQLREDPQFKLIPPTDDEGKKKLASPKAIALAVSAVVNPHLRGKRYLLTGGPTEAPIDDVRVIRNKSSGALSCRTAQELLAFGAEVEFVYGPGVAEPPPGVTLHRVTTPEEMGSAIKNILSTKTIDAGVFASAVLDFVPKKIEGKISSRNRFTLELSPIEKIIDQVLGIPKIGFKLEVAATVSDLIPSAMKLIEERRWDACFLNVVSDLDSSQHRGVFLSPGHPPHFCDSKREIGRVIREFLLFLLPTP